MAKQKLADGALWALFAAWWHLKQEPKHQDLTVWDALILGGLLASAALSRLQKPPKT